MKTYKEMWEEKEQDPYSFWEAVIFEGDFFINDEGNVFSQDEMWEVENPETFEKMEQKFGFKYTAPGFVDQTEWNVFDEEEEMYKEMIENDC